MALLDALEVAGRASGTVLPPAVHRVLAALPDPPGPLTGAQSFTGPLAAAVTVPGLLGATISGEVAIMVASPTGPGAPGFALTVSLDQATLTLPSGVQAATVTAIGTGPRHRLIFAGTGVPPTVTARGSLTVRGSQDHAATVTVDDGLELTFTGPDLLLPGGVGLRLPATVTATGGVLHLPGATLVLPPSAPVVGGLPCRADLTCGHGRLDLELAVQPAGADGEAPALGGTLSWHVPEADSLTQLVPTGGSVILDLPEGPGLLGAAGPTVDQPLRLRCTLARPPDRPGDLSVTVTVESEAPRGLLHREGPGAGEVAAGVAVTLAPAIRAGSAAATTAALLGAAAVVGRLLVAEGGFTVHGVTLDASAGSGPTISARVDLEGSIRARLWRTGPLGIGMTAEDRPMRVRWRDVRVTVDPTAPAGEQLILDYSRARPDVVDPGTWTVQTPGSLLDVVGTRSGHGSTWFEIDLRFVVDLGPVRVSGATVRATVEHGAVALGLRGLAASVEIPGVIHGEGDVSLTSTGFAVVLGIELLPVMLAAMGLVRYDGTGDKVEIGFAVDLPGPIPLGPTGLGLYGALGTFASNGALPELDPDDPFTDLRRWKPWQPLETRAGAMTIGMGVQIGTVPDGGFLVNALGVLGMTLPDLALRVGLDGTLLTPRTGISRTALDDLADRAEDDVPGVELEVFGGLSATPEAIDLVLEGRYRIPYLLDVRIPVGGHFPVGSQGWWFRAGSDDGVLGPTGRPPGPVSARVLPETPFACDGWAFLMVAGDGIADPGLLRTAPEVQGFAVGVGAGISVVLGAKGLLWAEISASLAALLSTRPMLAWVQGTVSGRLGLGPFRVGISATLTLQIWQDQSDGSQQFAFAVQVCGELDLVFDTVRRCITLDTLDQSDALEAPVPAPEDWPWPQVRLADGLARSLPAVDTAVGEDLVGLPLQPAPGGASGPSGGWGEAPEVWPDVVPILGFPIAPRVTLPQPTPSTNLGVVASGGAQVVWSLTRLSLEDVTDPDAPVAIALQSTARWQVPAGVGAWPAGTSGQRELVLLRRSLTAWAAHLAGDGSHLEPMMSPATLIGGACRWEAPAGPGWALGGDATAVTGGGWHVPPEHDPWAGTTVASFTGGTGFTVATAPEAGTAGEDPLPGATAYGGPTPLPAPVPAGDRGHPDGLRLRGSHLGVPGEAATTMRTVLTLDRPVVGGELYLLLAAGHDDDRFLGVNGLGARARAASGGSLALLVEDLGLVEDGAWVLARVALPTAAGSAAVVRIEVTVPWLRPAVLLGLHATAARDAEAADAGAAGKAAAAAADVESSQDYTQTYRLLRPGHRYRLSVSLGWTSRLSVPGQPELTGASGPDPVTRHWYFATARAPAGPPPTLPPAEEATTGTAVGWGAPWKVYPNALVSATTGAEPVGGGPGDTIAEMTEHLATALVVAQFRPGYLTRYVKGFTLPDRAELVFVTDALDRPGIEFLALHPVELAALYEREIGLLLRRTDRQATDVYRVPHPQPAATKPKVALSLAVQQAAQLVGCAVPPTELVLRWPEPLARGASYELSCVTPPAGELPRRSTPALAAMTFTTSHYLTPSHLIRSFGFTSGGARTTRTHGDLPVRAVSRPPGWRQEDGEVELLLHQLGLAPLRPTPQNRSSVLWARAGDSWGVVGILLESTEPLVRDGGARMGLRTCVVGGAELAVRRANRAGTVALWLTPTPVSLTAATTVTLGVTDRTTWLTRRTTIDPVPRFTATTLTPLEA
ncbi:hypothetical protein J4G33_09760 [Actinotalea sp. BY-33]|uniref:Uncharacterized protein n=1 Tax=Actinotalea soli TaxID=2819234 RepID=A0A939LQR3_9CELL|nr:hypothetical protein [Actinotalea soli]MBO1752088.1 hypothetical protein [Actinotalea soli]